MERNCDIHPGIEMAVIGLHLAHDGLTAILEDAETQGDTDDYQLDGFLVDDAAGIRWTVRQAISSLESQLILREKIRAVTRVTYPHPDKLADVLLSYHDAKGGGCEDEC
jgi:hypothetical protein